MKKFAVVVTAACLFALSGCGGDGDDNAKDTPKSSPSVSTGSSSASPKAPKEQLATADLTAFLCSPDAAGKWTATGVLSNTSEKERSYQVTVFVGAGNAGEARVADVADVAPGGTQDFMVTDLPAPNADAMCHVKVVLPSDG